MSLLAQDDSFSPRFRNITDLDGLAQNTVYSIHQDKKGFIWIGTQNGINRYDGWDFVRFARDFNTNSTTQKTSGNNIYSITSDDNNNLWIGTDKGIDVFDRRSETWRLTTKIWDSDDRIRKVIVHQNNLYVAGDKNFRHYEITTQESTISLDSITSIKGEISDILFDSGKILLLIDKALHNYDGKNLSAVNIASRNLTKLFLDSKERLWLGIETGYLIRALKNGTAVDSTFLGEDTRVSSIMEDRKGRIWAGLSNEGGIKIIQPETGSVIFSLNNDPADPRSIVDNTILSMFLDKDSSVWIGTRAGGISKYDQRNELFFNHVFHSEDSLSISNSFIWAIEAVDSSKIWVGTNKGGLNLYNPITRIFKSIKIPELTKSSIQSLRFDSRGWLWVGTESKGLFTIKNPSEDRLRVTAVLPDSMGTEKIKHIVEDKRDQSIWLGTQSKGLVHISVDQFANNQFSLVKSYATMNSSYVYTVHQDHFEPNKLYFGTYGDGLYLLELDSANSTPKYAIALKPDKEDSLKNNISDTTRVRVLNILQDPIDQNTLWISTSEDGVKKFNKKNETYYEKYKENNKLLTNTIYSAISDNDNQVWLSTGRGIARYDPISRTFENFGVNEGLDWLEFNAGSCTKDAFGNLYFGSFKGLLEFNPKNIHKPHTKSSISLTKLNLNGIDYTIGNQFEQRNGDKIFFGNDVSNITLRPQETTFSLSFTAQAYENYLKDKSYLEGKLITDDNDTLPVSFDKNIIPFNKLARGKYQLEVYDTRESPDDQSIFRLQIIVKKYPWEVTWIQLLFIALIIGVLTWIAVRSQRRKSIEDAGSKLLSRQIELRERINIVSSTENNEVLIDCVLSDLVNNQLFGFDYAVFSEADNHYDFLKAIKSEYKSPAKNPDDWIALSNYPLNLDEDVTTYSVINQKYLYVSAETVYEINTHDSYQKIGPITHIQLNDDIYNHKSAQHGRFSRVFFPVIRLKQGESESYGIGVIEAGKLKRSQILNRQTWFSNRNDIFSPYNLSELALYIDNLAQPYFRNAFDKQKKSMDKRLRVIDEKYLTSSIQYKSLLRDIIKELVIEINGVLGAMCFLSMENDVKNVLKEPKVINFEEYRKNERLANDPTDVLRNKLLEYDVITGEGSDSPNEPDKKTGFRHFRQVWFKRDSKSDYLKAGIDHNYQEKFKSPEEIKEVLLVPILYAGFVIGICKIYSNKVNHFNVQKRRFAKRFLRIASRIILRKKMDYFISKIVTPVNLIEKKVHNPLFISSLEQYFLTNSVSIWTRSQSGKYLCEYRSTGFDDRYFENQTLTFPQDIQLINVQEIEDEWMGINGFFNLIRVPIQFHNFQFGFIHIFMARDLQKSKVKPHKDLKENVKIFEYTRNYLSIISNKISTSIQSNRITKLIIDIANETAQLEISKENKLYDFIIEESRFILNASYVDIFTINQATNVIENTNKEVCILQLREEAKIIIENGEIILKKTTNKGKTSISIPIIIQDEIKGTLAVQYDSDVPLDDSFEEYIVLLTSLISPSKLLVDYINRNQQLFKENSRALKPVFHGIVLSGTIHNISNNFSALNAKYNNYIDSIKYTKGGKDDLYKALKFMDSLKEVLDGLDNDLNHLEEYWRNNKLVIPKVFAVKDLLRETEAILKDRPESKKISLTISQTEPIMVRGDFDLLRNVIMNLVINSFQAIKSAKSKGKVEVSAKINVARSYCIIRVEDDGPGIDEDVMSKMFDPYYTTKEEDGGTGLGLAISKYVVEAGHSGTLKNIQKKGGAIFEIRLRYSDPKKINN